MRFTFLETCIPTLFFFFFTCADLGKPPPLYRGRYQLLIRGSKLQNRPLYLFGVFVPSIRAFFHTPKIVPYIGSGIASPLLRSNVQGRKILDNLKEWENGVLELKKGFFAKKDFYS